MTNNNVLLAKQAIAIPTSLENNNKAPMTPIILTIFKKLVPKDTLLVECRIQNAEFRIKKP